jgi:non-specific serine/threonine protein kinase
VSLLILPPSSFILYNRRMALPAALRLSVFGSFQLERDARPLRLPTRKAESLLAYLALHPQPHAREKLAALLWGDFPDEQARASLRNALTTLRRLVGDELILADRATAQLNPEAGLWVDALAFRAQAEAFASTALPDPGAVDVDLYRGDLLAEHYDEWVLPERGAYRALYLATLTRLANLHRARGEYARAIEAAQHILVIEPADEAAHLSVMQSYSALGEFDLALRQYETCRRVLRDELGVEPSPPTTALLQHIRRAANARVAAAPLHNLPAPLTSFIGREREVEALTAALRGASRLITLTGPGGAGKTRLALRAAGELASEGAFADGVWWAELASAAEAALVPLMAAKALGLREQPGQSITDSLITYLHPKHLLLLLDNCEHLIVACAAFAERLLRACPQLTIIATSREALGLTGERAWPVPSLEPSSEAVRLFAERAAAVKFGFAVNDSNAPVIAQICQRLDGMPLAIELAAARIKALSPEQIAARLDDRFNLLTTGSRAALPRQQTLRAAMDWSHDLLDDAERVLFRRLAVFVGGFTLEAASEVIGDQLLGITNNQLPFLDLLTRLFDKSLLLVENARYRMLETVREYAADKLWLSGEEHALRRGHLRWCAQLAEDAEPRLISAEQAAWQERLERDHANLRAALRWAVQGDEAEVLCGLRLAGALWRFWDQRGYLGESRQQLEKLLALPAAQARTEARAKALLHAGILAHYQMERAAADTFLGESLSLWRELGTETRRYEALTRYHLGFAAHRVGDLAAARTHYEAGLALWRALGDEWGLSETLSNLGMLVRREGDYVRAHAYHSESLSLKRRIGDPRGVAYALWGLGQVALAQRSHAEARACFHESLSIAFGLNDLWTLPYDLEGLALLAMAEAQPERAAKLFGAVAAVRERTGSPTAPVWNVEHERAMAAAREQIGAIRFAAARAEGAALSLAEAVALALEAER